MLWIGGTLPILNDEEINSSHNNQLPIISSETIEIITCNTNKIVELELKLISSAKYNVDLLFSSTKAFHIQQRLGIIQSMWDMLIKKGIRFRILMPKTYEELEKINDVDIRYFNYNSQLQNKTLIVDREHSLVTTIN